MPPDLIDDQDSMGAGRDLGADELQVLGHRGFTGSDRAAERLIS